MCLLHYINYFLSFKGSRRSSVGSLPVDTQENEVREDEEEEEERERPPDIQIESLKLSAMTHAAWSQRTQATPLSKLAFDPYTCSEILRMHLLSSGGYTGNGVRASFRYCNRGGYSDGDDPLLEFRLNNYEILESLSLSPMYDLSPWKKLKIVSVLCLQLLSFASCRDYMEEVREKYKDLRQRIRKLQSSLTEKKKKGKNLDKKEEGRKEGEGDESKEKEDGKQEEKDESNKEEGPEKNEDVTAKQSEETPPETKKEKRARVQEEINKLTREQFTVSSCIRLQPLGSDRNHNQYWVFPSLPGLYIQQHNTETNDPTPINAPSGDPSTSLNNASPTDPGTTVCISGIEPIGNTSLVNNAITNNDTSNGVVTLSNDVQILSDSGQVEDERKELVDDPTTTTTTAGSISPSANKLISHLLPNSLWRTLSSQEELSSLLDALNPRGLREVALKETIQKLSPMFLPSLSNCPVTSTCYVSQEVPSCPPLDSSSNEYLELYLREQVLDLEEKIWIGNLGSVRDTKDRTDWRDTIESSGAASKYNQLKKEGGGEGEGTLKNDLPNGHDPNDVIDEGMEYSENGDEVSIGKGTSLTANGKETESNSSLSSVAELAKAILDIQKGIEKKFLLQPLGTAVDMKSKSAKMRRNGLLKNNKETTSTCLEEWQESLLKSTSFSQLFVHLTTLERAIAWSKSLMNMRCRICRRKGGDEYMLLCDGCDHGYHTYCLRPPVYDIPEDDWFCYNCVPVTPVKRRRNVISFKGMEEEEEEEEEESENEGEEEEEEEEESEEEIEEVIPKRNMRASTTVQRRNTGTSSIKLNTRSTRSKGSLKNSTDSFQEQDHKPKLGKRGRLSKKVPSPPPPRPPARKRLKVDTSSNSSTSSSSGTANGVDLSRAECIISSIIDVRCSKVQGTAQEKAIKTLESQLCKALLEELTSHSDSWPFMNGIRRRDVSPSIQYCTTCMYLYLCILFDVCVVHSVHVGTEI